MVFLITSGNFKKFVIFPKTMENQANYFFFFKKMELNVIILKVFVYHVIVLKPENILFCYLKNGRLCVVKFQLHKGST